MVVIGSLIFVLWFLTLVVCLVVVVVQLARKRQDSARRTGKTLGVILSGYLIVLVLVSVSTPRRILERGETWRFDHWGIAVESAIVVPESDTEPNDNRVAVVLRISNDALRASQRAAVARVFVTDGSWRRFDVSTSGQAAYEELHGPQQPLDTRLPPASSFPTVRVFDLPKSGSEYRLVVYHGTWPGRLIIGSEDSLFHKQTFIRLRIDD